MTEGDNGNGRVTLAIIGQKLDYIIQRLDKLERCLDDHEKRLQADERGAVQRCEQINALADDVERLQGRDAWGNVTTGLMAIIAGAVGWFKG